VNVLGFGQGIAVRFVEEGASVVLISRSPCDDTFALISKIEGFDKRPEDVALWVAGDISDEAACKAVVASTVARFGQHIHVLVNNGLLNVVVALLLCTPRMRTALFRAAALFVFKSVEDATG
jgi:NAD(P)-dependent dehydrogenase (short-subunit alcohol dehydrogenase family)